MERNVPVVIQSGIAAAACPALDGSRFADSQLDDNGFYAASRAIREETVEVGKQWKKWKRVGHKGLKIDCFFYYPFPPPPH